MLVNDESRVSGTRVLTARGNRSNITLVMLPASRDTLIFAFADSPKGDVSQKRGQNPPEPTLAEQRFTVRSFPLTKSSVFVTR